ncbi:hypothetical protein CVT24_010653 [Panaeolus cyanescens]|uniref:Cyclin N-terminal domain-containing protein n=1 Tax=Panaeolus cyanescens TaxID=181874 RepID=A0A409YM14_9AGAR|nr:hypothetical protein CVT24_010653 [Panaeolus cyanescens]
MPPYAQQVPQAHQLQNGQVNPSMPYYQGTNHQTTNRHQGRPPTGPNQSRSAMTLTEVQTPTHPPLPVSTGHQSNSQSLPSSSTKYFHQYFTPAEIQYLSEKQRGKMSSKDEDKDVALAALFVSTKMHDTLKKPRELLAVSYALRYPELLGRSRNPTGTVDLDNVEPQMVEKDRTRLLAVERLILETTCFNFTSRMPFPYVIKLGKQFKASKKLTKLAWRVAIDSYRTHMPLVYPPHSLALGSIYVASLLLSIDEHQPPPQTPAPTQTQPPHPQSHATSSSHPPPQPQPPDTSTISSNSTKAPLQPPNPPRSDEPEEITPGDLARLLNERLDWEDTYQTRVEDLEDFAHTLLDLIHSHTLNPSANTSPSTPSSPSPHLSKSTSSISGLRTGGAGSGGDPYPYKSDALLNLKIAMRQREHAPRSRRPLGEDLVENFGPLPSNTPLSATPLPSATGATFGTINAPTSNSSGKDKSQEKSSRQDETTIRYLFFPPGYDADGDVVMQNAEGTKTDKSKRRT